MTGKACPERTPVTLWVSEAAQPATLALAKQYQADPASPCVDYLVKGKSPIEAMIGLGQGQPDRPDGWIPDSPRWVERVNQTAKINAKIAQPFAKSPLVIAMDPAAANALAEPAPVARPRRLERARSGSATLARRRPACSHSPRRCHS